MTTDGFNKREAARLRKRKQRELAREAARLAAEQLAARREIVDESLAPKVRREPVTRADGSVLVGPRVVVQNGKPMRADPISNLARNSPLFGERHKFAARRLQQDAADVGSGINAAAIDLQGAGGGRGDGTGAHASVFEQIRTMRRLQGGLGAMGNLASGVVRVTVDCIPVSAWATEAGLEHKDAIIQVAAGLSRLAAFYDPTPDHPVHGNIRSAYAAHISGSYTVLASGAVYAVHTSGQAG
jgi:hypothetical protein